MPSFHNSIHAPAPALAVYERRASTQENDILQFFRSKRGMSFSPSQVWDAVYRRGIPLTSVRRAMTNLTTAELLEKLEEQVLGVYRVPEHLWRLARPKTAAVQIEMFA